ncbi:MAG: carbon-nitrogen hydrolase family protein [Oscillospiraceae bacterium]|nr:carbon-nitrogen hydrolase family protein [Oscillospiraceae bacterium]
MKKMTIAQLQTHVYADKEKNLDLLAPMFERAAAGGADLICLPEMFNCPYETPNFPVYAEMEGGPAWTRLSGLARQFHVYLSAGTIPEVDAEGKVYNTAFVFDRDGNQIAKHRKVHLFDIDVKGGQYFRESDTLTPGNSVTVFDTEFGRMGLCICFDCRFVEIARKMALAGAQVILVPAAFNMTTGPAHWEVMHRSRAIDNQVFMIGTSPARDLSASYHAWGHSMVVHPWGTVLSQMDEKAGMKLTTIDLDEVASIREQLPIMKTRRDDM